MVAPPTVICTLPHQLINHQENSLQTYPQSTEVKNKWVSFSPVCSAPHLILIWSLCQNYSGKIVLFGILRGFTIFTWEMLCTTQEEDFHYLRTEPSKVHLHIMENVCATQRTTLLWPETSTIMASSFSLWCSQMISMVTGLLWALPSSSPHTPMHWPATVQWVFSVNVLNHLVTNNCIHLFVKLNDWSLCSKHNLPFVLT